MLLLQGSILRHISLWGVFPFLFPVLTAVLGQYEGPVPGVVYGAVVGILCDLTVVAPLPCFYTVILPLTALVAALISDGLISAGFICSGVCSSIAFGMTGFFHISILWLTGQHPWPNAFLLMVREMGCSLLFFPLVFVLFQAVFRRCHVDD